MSISQRKAFGVILTILIVLQAIEIVLSNVVTGIGEATDSVHGLEYSGLVCKTWKVWLNKEVPTDKNDRAYSVAKENIDTMIPILQEAKQNGKTVHITYHTQLTTYACLDGKHSTYAIIDSVEILN